MKRFLKVSSIMCGMCGALVLSACTWKIPETVSLKTKAEYNFAIGSVTKSLSEFLSVETINEQLSNSSDSELSFALYNYEPAGESNTYLQFLADLSIKEIELDIGEMLPEDMDFESKLGDSLSSPIDIPEVPIPNFNEFLQKEMDIELPDFSTEMLQKINFTVSDFAILDNPNGNSMFPATSIPITVNTGTSGEGANERPNEIGTVEFGAGSLDITFTPKENSPANMDVNLVITMKCNFEGEAEAREVSTSGTPVRLSNTNGVPTVISLPLEGKAITTDIELSFEGSSFHSSTDNYMSGDYYYYGVAINFSDDADISKITGVTMELEDNGNIQIADGEGNPYKIDAVDNEMFLECSIGEGSLYIMCNEPEGWSGVTFTPTLTISGGLSANYNDFQEIESTNTDYYVENAIMNKELVLDGKSYTKDEIQITGNITVNIENATFTFNDDAKSIKIRTVGVIDRIDTVAVNLKSSLTDESGNSLLTYSVEYDLDDSGTKMSDYISFLTLEDFGISLPYSNTFPSNATEDEEGNIVKSTINTIGVSYYSKFFGFGTKDGDVIDYEDEQIYSWGEKTTTVKDENGVDQTVPYIETLELKKEGVTTIQPEENHVIDVELKLTLPGHDPVNDADFISKFGSSEDFEYYAIFRNIEPGKNYSIHMEKPKADLNWTEAGIKKSLIDDNLSSSVDTGIDLSNMLSSLTDALGDQNFVTNFEISSLPVFLYCIVPDLEVLDELGLSGTIVAKTINSETSEVTHSELILGEQGTETDEQGNPVTTGVTLTTLKDLPSLDVAENLEKQLVTKPLKPSTAKNYSVYADLASLLNCHSSGSLNLDYQLSLGESDKDYFTVTKEQFDNIKNMADSEDSKTNISIQARMILPMKFNIVPEADSSDVTIDITGLINKDSSEEQKDLFSRSEATDIKDIQKFMDILESVKLNYDLGNEVFRYSGNNSSMRVEMDTKIASVGTKKLEFGKKKELEISSDEFQSLLNTYPFCPAIKAYLPAGTVEIPKDAKISADLRIKVKTDGELNIFGGDNALIGGN